ncbi:MAG: ABC transporter substrate-binding protein [Leptospiraceae bacterium]|nr:ABC transporter substrate-binding protein [Leptospiraceae bacterium]
MIARYFLLLLLFIHLASLDRIHLQLKWYHQFQFAGYYAAIEKGYYSDVGLDVQLVETLDYCMFSGHRFRQSASHIVF